MVIYFRIIILNLFMKNNKVMSKGRQGFTLIELLVVIAIIGLLSTLAVVSLNGARSKARDARRVSDLKAVSSALELYRDDNLDNVVSIDTDWDTTIGTNLNATAIYLPAGAPTDPDTTRASGGLNEANSYAYSSDGDFYLLAAVLENNPPGKGLNGAIATFGDGRCVNAGGIINASTLTCNGAMNFCLGRL